MPGGLMSDQVYQKGFTLVEFLVSFTLVTILIISTIQLTINSLFVKRRADCNIRSAELVSSMLEYLKSLPYENDELREGLHVEHLKGENILGTFRREWKIQDVSPDIKRIEIESFSESYPQKKTRVILYLSRGLGF